MGVKVSDKAKEQIKTNGQLTKLKKGFFYSETIIVDGKYRENPNGDYSYTSVSMPSYANIIEFGIDKVYAKPSTYSTTLKTC